MSQLSRATMPVSSLAANSVHKSWAVREMPRAVLITALASAAATAAIAWLPELRSVYHWPALHVALETAAALIALLAAFLVVGRLRRHRVLNELLLACALTVLALSNLFFVTLPTLLVPEARELLTLWASLLGSLIGAVLFTIAAFVPRHVLDGRRLALVLGAAGGITVAVLGAALVRVFAARVPAGPVSAPPAGSSLHHIPVLSTAQFLLAVLYGLAVIGFLARSRELGDEFLGWLAIAAVLAAALRVNYCLYPALDSGSDYVAEIFRLSFYAVLLLGSMREISSYWRALSDAAVLEERRRIARDLHDGLAQELAYLVRNLHSLGNGADEDTFDRLRRAVERAQLESRRAIRALAANGHQPLHVGLAEAVTEIAERFNVELELDLAAGVRLPATREDALIRIACEAVTNAARHSGAGRVRLRLLHDGSRVRLRVSDTGCGFDINAQRRGFGLISMRERAESVAADLHIFSAPGLGTEVEAAL